LLASGEDDNTVRLWETVSGTPLVIQTGSSDGWIAFLTDGRYKYGGNVTGAFWHKVGLRRFEPGELDSVLATFALTRPKRSFMLNSLQNPCTSGVTLRITWHKSLLVIWHKLLFELPVKRSIFGECFYLRSGKILEISI
jgi:hypothetical protein